MSRIATIPLHRRSTIRKLASELSVSKSWLHKQFKRGLLRRHSNALKPCLKEENQKRKAKMVHFYAGSKYFAKQSHIH
jgi:hypothetical protein